MEKNPVTVAVRIKPELFVRRPMSVRARVMAQGRQILLQTYRTMLQQFGHTIEFHLSRDSPDQSIYSHLIIPRRW